jgi:hypothetical protein
MPPLKTLFWLGVLVILPLSQPTRADATADTLKTGVASRINEHIEIDGNLSEPAWQKAQPLSGFRLFNSNEGVHATDSTVIRFLYDDEAMYIGFWCFDREPDKIVRQLTRRDRATASDHVDIRIDSRHDHQTSFMFELNAAGVMRDLFWYNNNWVDESWDAVWEGSSKVHSWGWAAEMKIPYTALRFTKAEEYTWGIESIRRNARRDEYSRWQFVPMNETRGVARYGHLTGIKGIEPPEHLEVLPYSVSYANTEPKSLGNRDGRKYLVNSGVDVKYGLSPSFMLDATINPDFGQVESDQIIYNLSTYETYYPERRPFFLEGFDIFGTRFADQFYSRRIGRQPSVDESKHYLERPNNTTILGALKLSGKTDWGTSIGILNATTEREKVRYKVDDPSECRDTIICEGGECDTIICDFDTHEAVVEPLANYSVVRLKQDIRGNSYVGTMLTLAAQEDRTDALTGSIDWNMYMLSDRYLFSGQVIGTRNGPGTSGIAFATALGKESGKNLIGNVYFDYFDKKVNWNRMGFMSENNHFSTSGWMQLRSNKRFSIFRHNSINFNVGYSEDLDGYRRSGTFNVNVSNQFMNNWWVWASCSACNDYYDTRETRGNGIWHRPCGPDYYIGFDTDDTKKVNFEIDLGTGDTRGGKYYDYELWMDFRPYANFEFSVGPGYSCFHNAYYWVGNGEDGRPVFALMDNDEVDINFRGTYTIRKDMTLQWFTQFYFSAGEYDSFQTLTGRSRFDPVDPEVYDIEFYTTDYNYKSLNLNLIFRWEYRPGSTVYAVWTHNRGGRDRGYGDYDFSRDMEDLFRTPQFNTFLVKFNYWWSL